MKYLNSMMEFIYPRGLTCVICHSETEGQDICKICNGSLQFNIGKVCKYCGRMIHVSDYLVCDNCKMLDRHFDAGTSVVLYDDFVKKMIFNLKYYDKRYIAATMADMILKKIVALDLDIDFDYIVPIPLHGSKKRSRGYNQAILIADELSKITGITVNNSLIRIKETRPLNKLSVKERQETLFEAFALNSQIKGNIILVDDIFTTGTTVNTCSQLLKKRGSDYIMVATYSVGE